MLKKIVLVVAAVSSFSVLADTDGQSYTGQFDTKSLCIYDNGLYSIGATVQSEKTTLTCIMAGKTKNGSTDSSFKTAHWG